ncbi:Bestrophin, RFP-TM, chloride channel-domain-containing protein [Crucibulum laeve]|uniref:Bestrophin, RFP-TM, chloride channel-domain-containing protein n=1 Tax=Crucibulum laeve TaxID=68775 RepID=A0A5C3MCY3_9AGAR|nr:Bestrophin, RFP-TM, chloride channel-domain-containing protein [Crucibulum laeve]
MVAKNPLFRGRWTAKRFNATVINDIWPEVLFFTLVATMVYLVSEKTSHKLAISNQLLTVLGTVLGLVISFRTSSAYERYQDGRKMWTNITTASRNLAQMIWIHIPNEREDKGVQKKQTELQSIIEKKTMINLVQAFAVSVKHFLRGEEGVYYEDLYPLIAFLPRYANNPPAVQTAADRLPLWHIHDEHDVGFDGQVQNPRSAPAKDHPIQRTSSEPTHSKEKTLVDESKSEQNWKGSNRGRRSRRDSFDPEMALPQVDSEHPLKPARNPPEPSIYDYIPLLRFFKWCIRVMLRRAGPKELKHRKRKAYSEIVESNVPLEIMLVLSNYTAWLMRAGLLQPAIATGVTNNLTMLQDTLSNLERICNTPLPFAYQAHLRMSLWLYLFFLPFQIESAFKYLTIPGTAFASFLLLGFLEIGQEIENPFNYDLNDLDLDHFCLAIQRELHEITAHTSPNPAEFIFSAWNQPLAPADRRTAEQLAAVRGPYRGPDDLGEPGMDSVRRTLVKGWKDVDVMTRKL